MNEIFNIQCIRTDLSATNSPESREAMRELARLIARRLRQDGVAVQAEPAQTMAQVS